MNITGFTEYELSVVAQDVGADYGLDQVSLLVEGCTYVMPLVTPEFLASLECMFLPEKIILDSLSEEGDQC